MEGFTKQKRGIYLVANLNSQVICENLIYTIRDSGCILPIRLISFGGPPVNSPYILSEADPYSLSNFPNEAIEFINQLRTVLTDCPFGFLYRFLAWFGDWDEFIYSDNDVVALMNWENLFYFLEEYNIVHADEEYTTQGRFNYYKPEAIEQNFGTGSLLSAFTAGHFVCQKNKTFVNDMLNAVKWYKQNPDVAKKHDQALMHVASLMGGWKILNLCRAPHNWLSTWAGDYKNTLSVIHGIQSQNVRISHIHYSGGAPSGIKPIDELLYSSLSVKSRIGAIVKKGNLAILGFTNLKSFSKKVTKRLKRIVLKGT